MQAGRQHDEDASSSVSAEAGLFWGYRSARTMNGGIEPQSTRLDAAASWRVSLTGQCHHLPKFVWVSTWYYIGSEPYAPQEGLILIYPVPCLGSSQTSTVIPCWFTIRLPPRTNTYHMFFGN